MEKTYEKIAIRRICKKKKEMRKIYEKQAKEIIYEDRQRLIKITIDKNYDQEFLEMAENTLRGTDGVFYTMKDLGSELDKLANSIFVSLKENDELSAICMLNQKQICQNDYVFDAFYRCLLIVHPKKRSRGYATLLVNKITEYIFNKFNKIIIYSYVEIGNNRSRRVLEKSNYTHLTTFVAPAYVSLNPKFNKNVSKLDKEDHAKMRYLLDEQYKDHSFVDINDSFNGEDYYVLKENNEIKAGLQVKILRWSFKNLVGFEGFLMMKIVPKIPILKKIFNPNNHSFLKIGNIYIGDNKSFGKLLRSVLYLYKLHTCLAYTNPNSNIDSKIMTEMNKGIFSSVKSKAIMFCKTKNIALTDIENTQFLSLSDSV